MRVRLAVLLAAIGGTLSVCATEASAALEFCSAEGRSCALLAVPLDRSGAVPGTVRLRIERTPAKRAARPPLFLVAGGPGQSATRAFDRFDVEQLIGTEARSRDVVVMDLRGTGGSDVLDCPTLQRQMGSRAADSAACAKKLGVRRDFYTSIDSADDIDAVRQALGAERITILGVSYGTHVALTYARRYPDKVDRLVLDSAVGPNGVDALKRPSMRAIPRVLRDFCGKRLCRSFTRDAGADVSRLAGRLERGPLTGLVTDRHGRRHRSSIDGDGLVELAVAGDSDPFLRAEIPGSVHSALRGDMAPLLRSHARAARTDAPPRSPRILSAGAYVATLCGDTTLPWAASTPVAGRRDSAAALLASSPAGAFAPFGPRTALESGVLDVCGSWPSSSRPSQSLGPLPDVPTLILAGNLDLRTPVEDARAVAGLLPRATLLTVRNASHNVPGWDLAGCVDRAVRRFLAGGDAGRCGAVSRFMAPLPAYPSAFQQLSPASRVGGRAGRTVRAVQLTFADGFVAVTGELFAKLAASSGASNPFAGFGPFKVGALRGGRYALLKQGLGFERASVVPGVHVTGTVRAGRRDLLQGVLRVSGPKAARGRLVLRRGVLRGTLGGRRVRVPFRVSDPFSIASTNRSSSQPARLAQRLSRLR